jgi:hypothetical protein
LRKPIAVAEGMGNIYPETNITYSPDGKSILTGLPGKQGMKGSVVFLSAEDLSEQRRIPIGEGAVVRVLWHSKINQVGSISRKRELLTDIKIFATTSKGAIHVLYSPHSSIHGALLPMQKMPRTAPRDPSYSTADLKPVIYTPDALPMFADQGHRESLHQKDKRAKKLKPTEPMQGAGRGGRLGASATAGLVQDMFMKERLAEDVSLKCEFWSDAEVYSLEKPCSSSQIKKTKTKNSLYLRATLDAYLRYRQAHRYKKTRLSEVYALPPLSLYFFARSKISAFPSVTTFSAGGLTAR